jgi:hypothetical protein
MGWVEISKEFKNICSTIPIGKLIHTKHFDLMQAVFSMPIMDQKIDSGVILPTPKERGKWEEIPDLSIKDIIGAIDSLLQMKVDYFNGKILTSTVYASLFVRRRKDLKSRILSYFIAILVWSVNVMRQIVIEMAISFEEDFFPKTYDCDLKQEYIDDHTLLEQMKSCSDDGNSYIEIFKTIDDLDTSSTDFKANADAVIYRLEFFVEWSAAVKNIIDLDHSSAEKRVQKCLELLEKIELTVYLGNDMLPSLDVMVHRLKFPTFQLFPIKLNIPQAMHHWKKMLLGIVGVCQFYNQTSFSTVLIDLNEFHVKNTQSNIFIRSFLYKSVLNAGQFLGREDISIEIQNSIDTFYSVPYRKHANIEVNRLYKDIIYQYEVLFANLLKIMCTNRARQRRQLIHFVKEMDAAQSGLIDTEISLHQILEPQSEVFFSYVVSILYL